LKLIREYISEKFEEESDPIHDLGIGMKKLIKQFIKENGYEYVEEDLLLICARERKVEFVKYLLDAGADVHADNDRALQWASDKGHTEIVKLLLDAGADVHARDDYALRWASDNGHTEVVKLLLDAGADVHAYDDYALRAASDKGHTEVVKLLLDAGADVHASDDAALRLASHYGRTEVVKLLLDAGTDVHAKDDLALRWASEYGYTEVVKLLLDAGADVHANDDFALRLASHYGCTEVVKLLLDAGADVHAADDLALRWASGKGHTEVVKLLKDHIAKEKGRVVKESLNEKFEEESDPISDLGIGMKKLIKQFIKEKGYDYIEEDLLWICAREGKVEFVKYLLDAGADVHADDDLALRVANHYRHTEIVKLLKDYIAKEKKRVKESLNEKFEEKSDPISDLGIGMKELIKQFIKKYGYEYVEKDLLWICAKEGKVEFVKYLLNAGENVHANKDYALQWASDNGHTEVVKLLLDAGADVHTYDDYALRWASENGHTEVVKLLLDARADVHAADDAALQWASVNGHTEVVKLLLDAGADVHAYDDAALQWASHNGHTEIVKLLKDYIAKEKRKKVKESLNEKFEEDSDPISDLGIGMPELVKKWFEKEILGKTGQSWDTDAINNPDLLLRIIAFNGKTEFINYAIDKGADVHTCADLPLLNAIRGNYVDTALKLIEHGANYQSIKTHIINNFLNDPDKWLTIKKIDEKLYKNKIKESLN
jgi:ankyrin repeat protein